MIDGEIHEVLIALVGAVPPSILAGAAWYVALTTKRKVAQVHVATNSMKDALVAATDKLARMEGFAAGVASTNKPTQSQDLT
jgi:hypothetical protein